MSTLTKILIVLLTLSSIFLCGITVTYVGTANNYKTLWSDRNRENQTLKQDKLALQQQVNNLNKTLSDTKIQNDSDSDKLQQEIHDKEVQIKQYQEDLVAANERLKDATTIMGDYSKTIELNNQLRDKAEQQVIDLSAQQTINTNKIKELNDTVVNLSATIDQLEIAKKQLIEEKTKLQNDLDRTLQLVGRASISPTPVTPFSGPVGIAPATKEINLEGVIREVKPKDSLASISIGSAHGVKDKMKFHVIRNDKFICDIVISKVDADQASGYLDLVTDTIPRAGDIVKTNF